MSLGRTLGAQWLFLADRAPCRYLGTPDRLFECTVKGKAVFFLRWTDRLTNLSDVPRPEFWEVLGVMPVALRADPELQRNNAVLRVPSRFTHLPPLSAKQKHDF